MSKPSSLEKRQKTLDCFKPPLRKFQGLDAIPFPTNVHNGVLSRLRMKLGEPLLTRYLRDIEIMQLKRVCVSDHKKVSELQRFCAKRLDRTMETIIKGESHFASMCRIAALERIDRFWGKVNGAVIILQVTIEELTIECLIFHGKEIIIQMNGPSRAVELLMPFMNMEANQIEQAVGCGWALPPNIWANATELYRLKSFSSGVNPTQFQGSIALLEWIARWGDRCNLHVTAGFRPKSVEEAVELRICSLWNDIGAPVPKQGRLANLLRATAAPAVTVAAASQ